MVTDMTEDDGKA